jgi:hypothetical protein
MSKVIPNDAFLIKEGLYVHERTITLGSLTRTAWDLYSAEGWCFYDLQQAENYVDGIIGGELVPEDERVYAQFATMPKDEAYVTNNIISVREEVSDERTDKI